jgi:hypothetical protein
VQDRADGLSSLLASLSSTAELLEGYVDTEAANGVHWGTRSTLVACLSHFPKLVTEVELLGSKRNADLLEDHVDALLIQACLASDSLSSHVLPSVVHSSPDSVGE